MNESILSPSFTLRLSCKQRRNSSMIPSFTILLGLWSFSFTCPFCYGSLFFHYWPWTFFNSLTSPFLIELAGVESLFLIFSFLSQTVNEERRNLNLLELFHKVKLFDWKTFTIEKMNSVLKVKTLLLRNEIELGKRNHYWTSPYSLTVKTPYSWDRRNKNESELLLPFPDWTR